MGRLAFQESVTITSGNAMGQEFPLKSSNSGYVQEGMGYYTPDWGSSYTNITDTELLLTVRGDRIESQRRTVPKTKTTVPIPSDGYLLVVRAYREAEVAMPVGTTVKMNRTVLPNEFDRFTQVLGAGPLLLQNRQIVLNAAAENFSPAFSQEAATRSIVGVTADGKMELVAIANRIGGRGATLADAARIAQQMGFVSALNLDGGSSTTLYLGGQMLDRVPSTAARVHNGIGLFIKPGS
jgi:Phosphodiester glycosidase